MDEPTDIARRLKREARRTLYASRYWAGWRLSLTYGPIYEAFKNNPERLAFARETTAAVLEQVTGKPAAYTEAEIEAAARETDRDLWHLSVSWRGGHAVEDARGLLAGLVAALGVPEAERNGVQKARAFDPSGRPSPQVTHWVWRDLPAADQVP